MLLVQQEANNAEMIVENILNLNLRKFYGVFISLTILSALLKTSSVNLPSLAPAVFLNLKTIIATTATSKIYSVDVCPLSSFK